jgi:hypothetical protein
MKRFIKKAFNAIGYDISKVKPRNYSNRLVSLKPTIALKGNVLLSYVIEPFLLKDGQEISNAHTHDWESYQIAKTFLDLGYAVDIIDYNNSHYVPQKKYAIFVSARTNFQRIADLLNPDCIKIVHLDTAHWLFNNSAAYKRCLSLKSRKGVTVNSMKWVEPNWAIEHADFATLLGNDFTFETYSYSKKEIYKVPIAACSVYPSPDKKDFNRCRKNYLWIGSSGLVHKGLDLVLDVFKNNPDNNLYVCGPIDGEIDFKKAYYNELYNTENIHTIGWVNIESSSFKNLLTNCIGLVYPSCSEGQAGAVVTCLHAGLIPIVSYESGVDVNGFGVTLKNSSHEEIQKAIEVVSVMSELELKDKAVKAWEYARRNHTRERFTYEFKSVVLDIIKNAG